MQLSLCSFSHKERENKIQEEKKNRDGWALFTKQHTKLVRSIWSLFTLRLVADGGNDETLGILCPAVDDEEQRRVHADALEVKRLEKNNKKNNATSAIGDPSATEPFCQRSPCLCA